MLNLLITLAIGAVAGWLSGVVTKRNDTLVMNIILGIAGGFVGGLFGFGSSNIIISIIIAAIFAAILVIVYGFIKKKM